MPRHGATVIAVLGLATISMGVVRATDDNEKTYTVEVLPVPAGSGVVASDLSADDLERGRLIADGAIKALVDKHPELDGATLSEPTPVYDENVATPVGVSVRLVLPKPVNITMDLVRTIVDDSGELVAQALPSEITNLRGLVMDVSLESGEVEALDPLPFADDVNRPDEATQVHIIDGEQYRLYPDGDPRGDDE